MFEEIAMAKMGDTQYATELRTSKIGDNRIERLFIKEHKQVEIRVSLVTRWTDGEPPRSM